MQTQQSVTLETLRAVVLFLDKHAPRLGDVGKSGSRRQLDQLILDMDALGLRQATSATVVSGAAKAKELRLDLIEKHMRPIAKIASIDLPRTPELVKLSVPKGNPTPEKLVKVAEQMRELAVPHRQTFIDAGLPEDFLDELDAAAKTFSAFAAERKGSVGTGKAATTGIKATISRATRVIDALDSLIQKALDRRSPEDKLLLTEWRSVKKVRKTATRSAPPEPLPIPPASPASTTSTGGPA